MAKIVAYVPDLMDRSRFGAVSEHKVFVKTVDDLAGVSQPGDVVIVDLARPGALQAIAGLVDVKKVAFASHIDPEAIDQARALGVDAMARSRFFSRIVDICAQGERS